MILFAQFQDANRIRRCDSNDMYLSWNVKVVKFQFVFAHFSFLLSPQVIFFKIHNTDLEIGRSLRSQDRFTQYVQSFFVKGNAIKRTRVAVVVVVAVVNNYINDE